jgi:hypothetical protein
MKVKTNVHAGAGGSASAPGQKQTSKSSIVQVLYTYIPAISRCVGI